MPHPVDLQQMRRLAIASLPKVGEHRDLQFTHLTNVVARVAGEQSVDLTIEDFRREEVALMFQTVMQQLAIEGLIVPGTSLSQPNFPFFRVTEYGLRVATQGHCQPYDPDRYITRLKAKIPDLDSIAEMYLAESLTCLRCNACMASVVMLGGAAERIFVVLVEKLRDAFRDRKNRANFERKAVNQWRLKHKFDAFKKEMDCVSKLDTFPRRLREDLTEQLDGIFSIIRRTRNEFGHPTGAQANRDDAYPLLLLFPHYCETAYKLMHFFKNNKI